MVHFEKFRFPYRDDMVFGILTLLTLTVPLAVTLNTYEHYEVIKFSLWLILVGWAVFAFVLKNKTEWKFRFHKTFFFCLGLLWLLTLGSVMTSVGIHNSIFGFYPRFSSSLLFVTVWVLYMVLAAATDREKLIFLLKVLVFDALLVAIVGILQSYGIAFYLGPDADAFLRAPSLLGNPNFSTMFLVMLFPVTVVFFMAARSWACRLYYGFVSLLIIAATILLSSRGSLVGLYIEILLLLAALGVARKGKYFAFALLVSLLVLGGGTYAVLSIARPGSVASAVNLTDANVHLRFGAWETALQAMVHRPLLGYGPGNFQTAFERYRQNDLASVQGQFDDPHSILLHVAATSGIPAAAAFALLGLIAVVLGWLALKRQGDLFAIAASAGVVGFFAMASFNPAAIPCYLLLGILLLIAIEPFLREKSFAPLVILKSAFCIASAAFILYGVLLIVSEHLFFKGYEEYQFAANAQKAYAYTGWAVRLNPANQLFFVYHNRAAIALKKPDAELAEEIETMKDLDPANAVSYSRAATSYFIMYMQDRQSAVFDKAVQNMEAAIIADPYYAARYGRLGYMYYSSGKMNAAKEFTKTSLTLDDHYLPGWVLLAKIYQTLGRRDQVVYALNKAFTQNPDIRDLKFMLQMARQTSNIRLVPIPAAPQFEE